MLEGIAIDSKHARYNRSVKGRARSSRQDAQKKERRSEEYLTVPFVAWDGEGVTSPDGNHLYIMLVVSDGGETFNLSCSKGIPTARALEFIIAHDKYFRNKHGKIINVIYGGGYDTNMILKDLSHEHMSSVLDQKYAWVESSGNAYRVGWRPGKQLEIKRYHSSEGAGNVSQNVTIYDVVSFFQCTFVKACDGYLGDEFPDRELIVSNKALRSQFSLSDVPEMLRYCTAELKALMMLMTELRSRLDRVGLRVQRWIGPGAVAASLMREKKIKECRQECPSEVAAAARYAYAGGRFELIKFGIFQKPVRQYDINSAYPAALKDVPDLTDGKWEWSDAFVPGSYGLWHTRWDVERDDLPSPLWMRVHTGQIFFTTFGHNWFWTPEIETAYEYLDRWPGTVDVEGGWVFVPRPGARKPFDFIPEYYERRRELKAAGDGAQAGIKLALNSLYGKLAQQVGWNLTPDGTVRIPTYHQLEWAGYATSYCRANVLRACLDNLPGVVSFETDAVFTFSPLPISLSPALGDFSETVYDGMTVWQSGKYFVDELDGSVSIKARGVDKDTLSREAVEAALSDHGIPEIDPKMTGGPRNRLIRERVAAIHARAVVTASQTRFIGARLARARNWEGWCRWVTAPVQTSPRTLDGKRMHIECTERCEGEGLWGVNRIHATSPSFAFTDHSVEFPVEWINPNPELMVAEQRLEHAYNKSEEWS